MLTRVAAEQRRAHARQVLGAGGNARYTVLFNTTAVHGLPAALNSASNALARAVAGPGVDIRVANHPMPTLRDEAAVKFSKVAGEGSHIPCPVVHLQNGLSRAEPDKAVPVS